MAEETFETFVQRERDRLRALREALIAQQRELAKQIADVDRELEAVDAYEAAKTGKTSRQSRGRGRQASSTRRGRGGSKREGLIKLITGSKGLTRGEILEKMGLKGNKAGEMSVSNALTALTKSNQILRRDRKYVGA
jgi:hypothetical protein